MDVLEIYISEVFLAHHDVGDDFDDFVMAAAASRGAVGYFLYAFKGFENAVELIVFMECIYDIEKAYFLALADLDIFFHGVDRSFLCVCRYFCGLYRLVCGCFLFA